MCRVAHLKPYLHEKGKLPKFGEGAELFQSDPTVRLYCFYVLSKRLFQFSDMALIAVQAWATGIEMNAGSNDESDSIFYPTGSSLDTK